MRQAILLTSLTLLVQLLPVTGYAASADSRACNLQGREIALRITEEVRGSLDSAERNKIAAIAEEVCMDFASPAAAAPAAQSNRPVISRPSAAQPANAAAPVAAAPEPMADSEAEDEGNEGLFGNIRVIPAEERVQRPGLKRK